MSNYNFKDPLTYRELTSSELNTEAQGVFIESHNRVQKTYKTKVPAFHERSNYSYHVLPSLGEPVDVTYPPVFALALNNVKLVGYRCVLSSDSYFCLDESYINETERLIYLNRMSSTDSFLNEETGMVKINDNFDFRFELRDRHIENIDETVIVIDSFEPPNYGSFLFRILPKFKTIHNANLNYRIIGPNFTKSMSEFYNLIDSTSEKVISHLPNVVYNIKRAILISLRNKHAYLDDQSINLYQELRQKYGVKTPHKKIYITRKTANSNSYAIQNRIMLNEDALISTLINYGFEIIEPSGLSAIDQIKLFSSAKFIVTASGSAMFNVVFCHPGTKLIDIESEPHWIHAHRCLFSSLDINYGIFEATPSNPDFTTAHKPYTVNIVALMKRIKSFDV